MTRHMINVQEQSKTGGKCFSSLFSFFWRNSTGACKFLVMTNAHSQQGKLFLLMLIFA
jgi:hypothetical protein